MRLRDLVAVAAISSLMCAPLSASAASTASPAPSPSPSPSPTPPPHAASCSDSSTSPYSLSGTFPSSATAGIAVNTTVQILPDSADGRSYLAQQEAQVKHEQAALSPQAMSANALTTTSYSQGTSNAQALSALLARLGSQIENTTTDTSGNWACQGITFATPYLLWVTLTITSTTASTPVPGSAAVSNALGTQATQHTQTTQIYYTRQLTAAEIRRWFLQRFATSNVNTLAIPFNTWTQIAQVTQPG